MNSQELEEFRQDMLDESYREFRYEQDMRSDEEYFLDRLNNSTDIIDALTEAKSMCYEYDWEFEEVIKLLIEEM